MTLNKLLEDCRVEKIDFLSMDIEESELEALAGFDVRRYQPDLVCIECHPRLLADITAYFESNGYRMLPEFVSLDITNRYFVPARHSA